MQDGFALGVSGMNAEDVSTAACLKHQLLAFTHAVSGFHSKDGARQAAALALLPEEVLSQAMAAMAALTGAPLAAADGRDMGGGAGGVQRGRVQQNNAALFRNAGGSSRRESLASRQSGGGGGGGGGDGAFGRNASSRGLVVAIPSRTTSSGGIGVEGSIIGVDGGGGAAAAKGGRKKGRRGSWADMAIDSRQAEEALLLSTAGVSVDPFPLAFANSVDGNEFGGPRAAGGPGGGLDQDKQRDEAWQRQDEQRRASLEGRSFMRDVAAQIEQIRLQTSHAASLKAQWHSAKPYVPVPVQLGAVRMPSSMEPLAEKVAAMVHEQWLQGRLRSGWGYAEVADQARKLHPNVVPYVQLAEADKVPNRALAVDTVKIILATGLTFESDGSDSGAGDGGASAGDNSDNRRGSGQLAKQAGARIVTEIPIPGNLQEVVEILSFHAHEIWAVEKFRQGFRYAPARDDAAKEHPLLIPYYAMEEKDKEWDLLAAQNAVRAILAAGFSVVKPAVVNTAALLDLDKVVELNSRRNLEQDADVQVAKIIEDAALMSKLKRKKKRHENQPGRGHLGLTGSRGGSNHERPTVGWSEFQRVRAQRGVLGAARMMLHRSVAYKRESALDPASNYVTCWNTFLVTLILYSGVTVPLFLAFELPAEFDTPTAAIDIGVEMVFLFDIWQNFHVGYVEEHTGRLVLGVAECAKEYLHNWFLLDCVGSIPVELLRHVVLSGAKSFEAGPTFKMARFVKFFRLVRLMRLRRATGDSKGGAGSSFANPSLVRLTKLAFGLLISVHWVACIFWGLHKSVLANDMRTEALTISGQAMEQRRWRFDNAPLTGAGQGAGTHGAAAVSFAHEYSTAFYWSFLSIMGSDMLPNTQQEQWFTILASFFGLAIVSAIIGGFSSTLAQLDAHAAEKKEQEIKITGFLKRHKVSRDLQLQITQYYDYIWKGGHNAQDDIFRNLPPLLMAQLQIALKRRLVEAVPMFNNCSSRSAVALVRRLDSFVAIPDGE